MNVYLPSFQTLTTLNLERNQIGQEGARYLSDMLRSNTVSRMSIFQSDVMPVFFNQDSHHTPTQVESTWCRWNTVSQ